MAWKKEGNIPEFKRDFSKNSLNIQIDEGGNELKKLCEVN